MTVAERIGYTCMFSSPVLNEDTWSRYSVEGTDGELPSSRCLSVGGTAFKAFLLNVLLLAVSLMSRSCFSRIEAPPFSLLAGLLAAAAVLSAAIAFFPQYAFFTAVLFSVVGGITVSCAADYVNFGGVLMFGDAVVSTAAAVLVMLAACSFFAVKIKTGNGSIILGTLFGPFLYYGLLFAFALLGGRAGAFSLSPWMLFLSCALCAAAACSAAYSFTIIQIGVDAKIHNVMEWYCAFALMFNLLWFYFELFFCVVFFKFLVFVVPMLYGFYD